MTAGQLDPVQRTMNKMKLFWDFGGLPGRDLWRSLDVNLEEEQEGRSWELHSEEQCGIKYAEHLRASCYSYPLQERNSLNFLVVLQFIFHFVHACSHRGWVSTRELQATSNPALLSPC